MFHETAGRADFSHIQLGEAARAVELEMVLPDGSTGGHSAGQTVGMGAI